MVVEPGKALQVAAQPVEKQLCHCCAAMEPGVQVAHIVENHSAGSEVDFNVNGVQEKQKQMR